MSMAEIKVSDAVAVHAAKILERYCDTRRMDCLDCVFHSDGYCQFRDSSKAPIYWTVPTGYEEVELLVGDGNE